MGSGFSSLCGASANCNAKKKKGRSKAQSVHVSVAGKEKQSECGEAIMHPGRVYIGEVGRAHLCLVGLQQRLGTSDSGDEMR